MLGRGGLPVCPTFPLLCSVGPLRAGWTVSGPELAPLFQPAGVEYVGKPTRESESAQVNATSTPACKSVGGARLADHQSRHCALSAWERAFESAASP
jgi:hypothetical protein